LGVEPTAPAVPAKVERDTKGNIVRPDWSQKTPAVQNTEAKRGIDGIMRKDWNRNESGQFVTKSEADMRAQWAKENGIAQVGQTVMRKEQTMYSVAPSLEAKVTEHLDRNFLMKAADHLRLSPGHGPEGFWQSVKQFEDSLSPSEREAWGKFCRSLNEDEQAALLYGMSK
jgi:hypothetical protein